MVEERNGRPDDNAERARFSVVLGAEPLLGPVTGVGGYTWALYRGLRNHHAVDDCRLVANGRLIGALDAEQPCPPPAPAAPGRLRRLLYRIPGYVPMRRWSLGLAPGSEYRRWRALSLRPPPGMLYHEPNFVLRPFAGPCVATVHDLAWVHYPETLKPDTRRIMEAGMPKTLERADRLLTVSQFVADELVQVLGIARSRVCVTPNGVDKRFYPRAAAATAAARARGGLAHGGYLLAVATPEPRKNLQALVAAYARLPARLQARVPLVLVGGHGWGESLTAVAEPLQRRGCLRRLGYVPDAELPLLYAGALGLAFPSLYEGFGLPILEAMASGVPVLTSNGSAMAEVAGGAAVLVEPRDVVSITAGLERLLDDAALRARLVRDGLARAREFSWERTVACTVGAYAEVMGSLWGS